MKLSLGFAATGLCLALGAWSGNAHAGLSDCGNVNVEADAKCEVEVEAECKAHCEPTQLQFACSAQLKAECDGKCTAEATVDCKAACDFDGCKAKCDVDPGNFDCSAQCQVDAEGYCSGECINDDDCASDGEGKFVCRELFLDQEFLTELSEDLSDEEYAKYFGRIQNTKFCARAQ